MGPLEPVAILKIKDPIPGLISTPEKLVVCYQFSSKFVLFGASP